MPRPRKSPLFELGEQWIGTVPGSRVLYRFWDDAGAGGTRRQTLGTEDLAEAKLKLAEIVVKGRESPPTAMLPIVLEKYFSEHTDGKPSEGVSRSAGRVMIAFWGITIRVSALTEERQKEFVQSIVNRGSSLSYASRILTVLHSALRHAKIEHEIIYSEARIAAKWRLDAKAPRRTFVPSDDELARLLGADMPEGLWRWILIQMATAGRPQTAIDLRPAARMREACVVCLNPANRKQNKKYRATVREPNVLKGWLNKWEDEVREKSPNGNVDPAWSYCGYRSIEAVKTVLERLRAKPEVNLPRLSTYSFRHKVTTVLRRAKLTHRVTEDDIALQLGHRRPHLRTTAGYGEWDPEYLTTAAAAIDSWFVALQLKVQKRALFSQGFLKSARGRRKKSAKPLKSLERARRIERPTLTLATCWAHFRYNFPTYAIVSYDTDNTSISQIFLTPNARQYIRKFALKG